MLKYLTLLGLVVFLGWLLKNKWAAYKRELRGEPPLPKQEGFRPITFVSVVLIAVYGGYLLWYMIFGGD